MTRFTKGPWVADLSRSCVAGPFDVTVAHCGQAMTSCADGSYWIRAEESNANAHLIAAAPDLYAALDELVKAYNKTLRGDVFDLWDAAKSALAKARGES